MQPTTRTGRKAKSGTAFTEEAGKIVRARLQKHNQLLKQFDRRDKKTYFDQFIKYQGYPVQYISEVLGVTLWDKQIEICEAIMKQKQVLIRASHSVGKSYLLSCLGNYFFDCYPIGLGIITGSTITSVGDTLFGTMRILRKTRNYFSGDQNPLIKEHDWHLIRGLVAASHKQQNLAGRHSQDLNLAMIDEATTADPSLYEVVESMLCTDNSFSVSAYNPVNPTAYVKGLETSPVYKLIIISALEHPNIIYEVENPGCKTTDLPFPGAISLSQVSKWIRKTSKPIEAHKKTLGSICIPGTNEWFIPSTEVETRLLGRWATVSTNTVWNDTVYDYCIKNKRAIEDDSYWIPELGIDVARGGDDYSVIAVKSGDSLLEIDAYNSIGGNEFSTIIKEKVKQLAAEYQIDKTLIPIKIDENGVGATIVDNLTQLTEERQWNVIPIQVASRSGLPGVYYQLRDELWFELFNKADAGEIDFSRLPDSEQNQLRNELKMPKFEITDKNLKKVESKKSIKKRSGVSPDRADAVCLAFFTPLPNISVSVDE